MRKTKVLFGKDESLTEMYVSMNGQVRKYYSKDTSLSDVEKGIVGLENRILKKSSNNWEWANVVEIKTGNVLYYYHHSKKAFRLDKQEYLRCIDKEDDIYNVTIYLNDKARERSKSSGRKNEFNVNLSWIKSYYEKHSKWIAMIKIWSRNLKGVQKGYLRNGTIVWNEN